MAKIKYSPTETTFQRWIKEGRGAGRGRDYKPWLTVRDLPSQGRSHSVFGHKSQRTHHLFSDLELAVFLILEWQSDILEIREQFPLQRELPQELATKHGIRHPAVNGIQQFLSSDFLVNSSRPGIPKFALQVKHSSELEKPRTVEKLELERRYWQEKNVPWFLISKEDIPAVVFQNIRWLYPAQQDAVPDEILLQQVQYYSHHFQQNPTTPLVDLAKTLDVNYTLPAGDSLREIRRLLAQRLFIFDIHKEVLKLTSADLDPIDTAGMQEALHVQGK